MSSLLFVELSSHLLPFFGSYITVLMEASFIPVTSARGMSLRLVIIARNAKTLISVLHVTNKKVILIEWRSWEICLELESLKSVQEEEDPVIMEVDQEMLLLLLENPEDCPFKDASNPWFMPVNVGMPTVVSPLVIR